MLIAFEDNIFNTAHITTCELCVGGPATSLAEMELYIFFTGDTQLRFEGVEAIRLWNYLKSLSQTSIPELELPEGTIAPPSAAIVPPDRPWLEDQIEILKQGIADIGFIA